MHCGISGEVCEVPVLANGSGVIYEKRVILKYLESEGKDPATGEDLGAEDLVEIKASKVVRPRLTTANSIPGLLATSQPKWDALMLKTHLPTSLPLSTVVRPRPTTANSVPGLLATFQNEWDALMLETYTLKEHLSATRTELANALYQHDAACRVIARVVRERDEARAQLSALQSQFAQRVVAAGAEAMEVDEHTNGTKAPPPSLNTPIGITEEVIAAVTTKWEGLSKQRKKRPLPESLPSVKDLADWSVKEEHALHSTAKPGVLALDILQLDQDIIVTGGQDKEAVVFNRKTEKVIDRLKGHTKKINAVVFHPSEDFNGMIYTGSADKSVKLWKNNGKGGKYIEAASVTVHNDEITTISIQATGSYFATASKDKTWGFFDAATGQALAVVADPAVGGGYESLAFHPDGILLGTGTSANKVRMWDLKTQANVATFEDHKGAVKGIAFSENGYYMASASLDGTVKLWDLRKLKSISSLDVGDAVQMVTFDHSGHYLGVAAGKGVKVYLAKEWSLVAEYNDHSDKVTALKFGYPNSTFLASASLDKTVKVYSS